MNKIFFNFIILCLFISNSYAQNDVIINPDSTHQIIRGFGAANILQWRPDMTDSEIETAFGTGEDQLGFSILRLRIQPQSNLWSTNVRTAKKAHDMGVTIIASPWNPPEEMVETVGGQRKLNPDWYTDYAEHLDSFNSFMENSGVPLYAISIQNEPDYGEWTRWTAQEMVTFLKENASIIQNKIMAPESFQFRRPFTDAILNDPDACAEVDIIGGHIYGDGAEPYPLAESKGKEVWMTEHYTDSQNSGNLWPTALEVGLDVHTVMAAGMNAYIWWYIVRFYGPISDGTMDSGQKGEITKRGYMMAHYSRFVRPGYYRIECDSRPQNSIYVTAYKDMSSSKIVLVMLNTSTREKNQTFVLQNSDVEMFETYVTSEIQNCEPADDIFVSDGSFTMKLGGQSIMTLISKNNGSAIANSTSNPVSFKLFQNYPNPFNPSTIINFEIPEKSFVSLKVYNLLGKEIHELAGNEFVAGMHSVDFNASDLANGIYFYTLRVHDFISTRKMIIAK